MPTTYINQIHKKTGISKKTLEKFWSEAKNAAKNGRWGLVVTIFKNKVKKHTKSFTENFMEIKKL